MVRENEKEELIENGVDKILGEDKMVVMIDRMVENS